MNPNAEEARIGSADGAAVGSNAPATGEVPHTRSYFYVGGRYETNEKGQTTYRDQMYVEHLIPHAGVKHAHPLVLIHGQAQTGTNWLNKPDGGRGWASDFLGQGYEIYIVDQCLRGRSAWQPGSHIPSTISAELIEQRFTATAKHKLWPQAELHTQWPGTGERGDPVFDAFYMANVQFEGNGVYQQEAVQLAGKELLEKIERQVVLVAHSQGGVMPLLIADLCPDHVKAIVLLEPKGPPYQQAFGAEPGRAWGLTDVPITYDPPVKTPSELVWATHPAPEKGLLDLVIQADDPPPRQLCKLTEIPILLITGEASYHAPYDYCTVAFLRQAGCHKTEHWELGKMGIHGNGHMLFMEKNSSQIQNLVHKWLLSSK